MKIAHITNFFEPKYYASNEYFICSKMTELDHEIVLYCPDIMPKWTGSTSAFNIQPKNKYDFLIKRLPSHYCLGTPLMLNLQFELLNNNFNIIHTHDFISFGSLQSAIVSNIKKWPLIITQHNDKLPFQLNNRVKYLMYAKTLGKYTLSMSKKIIALTNDIKKHLIKMGADKEKIEVIPNAVDINQFSPDRINLLQNQWKIQSPIILYVGRLTAEKGVEFLIKAFSNVITEIPDAKLVIVGSGKKENELKHLQKKLKIKNIFFLGRIKNDLMPYIYSGCDVLVLPSFGEIFGNVVLEAMATQKPVIGSYVGGMKELIVHGKNGYHVPPKNAEKITEYLLKILLNDNLKMKLGKKSREIIIKKYSYDEVIKKINKIYIDCFRGF
ncbi:MAG: glycosyltransferase family 4 protein [Candidatus Hodarchaeota archaeon]